MKGTTQHRKVSTIGSENSKDKGNILSQYDSKYYLSKPCDTPNTLPETLPINSLYIQSPTIESSRTPKVDVIKHFQQQECTSHSSQLHLMDSNDPLHQDLSYQELERDGRGVANTKKYVL